jgi:uncharacterized protein YjbI with pentapeptide repeats
MQRETPMANPQHLEILKRGVEEWNRWRGEYQAAWPDLSGADLSKMDLSGANLSTANLGGTYFYLADLCQVNLSRAYLVGASLNWANLNWANLNGSYLSRAELSRASLVEANLVGTELSHAFFYGSDLSGARLMESNLRGAMFIASVLRQADLSQANLDVANLLGANLSGANLREAHLHGTNFTGANLRDADLSAAKMQLTTIGEVDLRLVKGLDAVKHAGPSTIGIDTIYLSQGTISEIFLRGAGVPDSLITYARSLANQPLDFYSCFISYSSHDLDFAERIYADLQSKGVRCWFAPEDLQIGAKVRSSIDESIRLHDKLLLVLSEQSVASEWVEHEVEAALERERKENRAVLFPIRLDNAIMETEGGWPALIRNTRYIGDFTHWRDYNAYQKGFARLLRDLKAEG